MPHSQSWDLHTDCEDFSLYVQKQHSKDSLAHSWIKVADSCVFLVLLLLLSGPAARAVVDAFDQEAGVGHDDGGRAYQDHPHPLSG